MELCYGMDNREESLWVRVRGEASKVDIVVGVCYTPPGQREEVDEAFLKQLKDTSGSQTLLLMGNFNLPDTCSKANTVGHKQSSRFLEGVRNHILI